MTEEEPGSWSGWANGFPGPVLLSQAVATIRIYVIIDLKSYKLCTCHAGSYAQLHQVPSTPGGHYCPYVCLEAISNPSPTTGGLSSLL